jgi:hypothetical protein
MLEMLPAPWGPVRSGVAPDHPMSQIGQPNNRNVQRRSAISFGGDIAVGDCHDALSHVVGAHADRCDNPSW